MFCLGGWACGLRQPHYFCLGGWALRTAPASLVSAMPAGGGCGRRFKVNSAPDESWRGTTKRTPTLQAIINVQTRSKLFQCLSMLPSGKEQDCGVCIHQDASARDASDQKLRRHVKRVQERLVRPRSRMRLLWLPLNLVIVLAFAAVLVRHTADPRVGQLLLCRVAKSVRPCHQTLCIPPST